MHVSATVQRPSARQATVQGPQAHHPRVVMVPVVITPNFLIDDQGDLFIDDAGDNLIWA